MRAAKLSVAALIAMPIGALAQDPPPQPESTQAQSAQKPSRSTLEEGQSSPSCISNIVFSQEFLARFPRAGGACREVKVQKGMKWARFDADVRAVQGNQVTADFVDRFDNSVGTITFDASNDARVIVNGESIKYSALKRGDRLSFWMPEDRVGFYAAPGSSETTKLAIVSKEPAQR